MKASDVIARVRDIVQDEDGVRYTDAELLRYISDAQRRGRSVRPDLFVGSYGDPILEITDVNTDLYLPDQFVEATALFVAGRAEIRDDEFAVDGRAAQLVGALTQKLLQGV